MGSFSKLKNILEEEDNFVLVGHVDPDGDAIGSVVALGSVLRANGKNVTLVINDDVPKIFDFLVQEKKIDGFLPKGYGTIVLLDNGDSYRTGFRNDVLLAKKNGIRTVNIDHHPKNDLWRMVNINYVNEQASSTCEILYDIFISLNFVIDAEIATALLAGIFYDTGGFQHQNTTQKVLDIAGELLRHGAKLKKISNKLVSDRSVSLFKLWGLALDRLMINQALGLSISVLTRQDLKETGANEDEISGLVGLLSTTQETKAAMLLYESNDGKIKGSLRTESDKINLTKLAAALGGGGHRKAAGFRFDGKIERTEKGWKIK